MSNFTDPSAPQWGYSSRVIINLTNHTLSAAERTQFSHLHGNREELGTPAGYPLAALGPPRFSEISRRRTGCRGGQLVVRPNGVTILRHLRLS